jgi:large subunit ribosomal protein L21
MYAVIETGGKQYRVEVGTELEVETLDAEPGEAITIDRVLLVADGDEAAIGRPLVADAAVHADVVRRDRGEKLIVFKYRPKARSRVKKGHRQNHTILRITDVRLGSRSAAEAVREAQRLAMTERQRLEEAAARQAAEDAALAAKLAEKAGPKPARSQPKADGKADAKPEAKGAASKPARGAKASAKGATEPRTRAAKADTASDAPKTRAKPGAAKPKIGRTRKDT